MGFISPPPPACHVTERSPGSVFVSKQDEKLNDTSRSPTLYGGLESSASSIFGLEKSLPTPPYHVFSSRKKKSLMYLVSIAGIFSSLSSNIYFPALGQISRVGCLSLITYKG